MANSPGATEVATAWATSISMVSPVSVTQWCRTVNVVSLGPCEILSNVADTAPRRSPVATPRVVFGSREFGGHGAANRNAMWACVRRLGASPGGDQEPDRRRKCRSGGPSTRPLLFRDVAAHGTLLGPDAARFREVALAWIAPIAIQFLPPLHNFCVAPCLEAGGDQSGT